MPSVPPTETDNLQALLATPTNVIVAHLSQNPIAFDAEQLVLTDFVESNFAGYAPIPVTDWTMVDAIDDNYGEAESPTLQWIAAEGVALQNITGVYLTLQVAPAAPVLLAAFPLSVPEIMYADGQVFEKVVRFRSLNPPA